MIEVEGAVTIVKCKNYGDRKKYGISPLMKIRSKEFKGHEGEKWEYKLQLIKKMKEK